MLAGARRLLLGWAQPTDRLMQPLQRAGQETAGPWEQGTRLLSIVGLQAVEDGSRGIPLRSQNLSACWCLERSGWTTRCFFHRPRGSWFTCASLHPSSSWALWDGVQHTRKSHPGASGRKRQTEGISLPLPPFAGCQALYKHQLI